jgi:hypothetical protein
MSYKSGRSEDAELFSVRGDSATGVAPSARVWPNLKWTKGLSRYENTVCFSITLKVCRLRSESRAVASTHRSTFDYAGRSVLPNLFFHDDVQFLLAIVPSIGTRSADILSPTFVDVKYCLVLCLSSRIVLYEVTRFLAEIRVFSSCKS